MLVSNDRAIIESLRVALTCRSCASAMFGAVYKRVQVQHSDEDRVL